MYILLLFLRAFIALLCYFERVIDVKLKSPSHHLPIEMIKLIIKIINSIKICIKRDRSYDYCGLLNNSYLCIFQWMIETRHFFFKISRTIYVYWKIFKNSYFANLTLYFSLCNVKPKLEIYFLKSGLEEKNSSIVKKYLSNLHSSFNC